MEMADDLQSIRSLEMLCKQMYESRDAALCVEAEKALVSFQNSNTPDTLSKCQMLLERADSHYSQLLATTTITKLLSRTPLTLNLDQRIQIRNYILNYLATRPKLPSFVVQALVLLFAKITKQGWFDGEKDSFAFRNVVSDISVFLQGMNVEHCMIGVQLLSQLTTEMNTVADVESHRAVLKHRKVASSFRDTQLFEIFRMSCQMLRSANDNRKNLNFTDETQHGFMSRCLQLAQNCLTYDFIGTTCDESSDDICTVQIPTGWRPAFLEQSTLTLFFDLYHSLPPSLSSLALSCLVQLASVRRSLFSTTERAKFLSHLVNGVKDILLNPQGLADSNNYHEFCRLLARLKSNYQLGELVMVDSYQETVGLIAKFTVESLQVYQCAPNSFHYLLSFWQRMVASVPYVKAAEPHLLETYTPEVTKAYISSRIESVTLIVRDGLDDPLDDFTNVQQQLEQLSVIGRCHYQKTCSLIAQLFDQSATTYQEIIASPSASIYDLKIQEGRLTWLVYLIGAAIGGRVTFNSNDDGDAMDGEMACKVLQLMTFSDSRLPQGGYEKLEHSFLFFFEQFRKIYIGDQVPKNSKVYRRLHDVLGISEEHMVLSIFMRKIITNLKFWCSSNTVIQKTLALLNDLSVGFSSVRKLVKLDEIQFLLNNHTSEHFPLLGNTFSVKDMRHRSSFYTSLGRLLMIDLLEDEDKFDNFMIPLTASVESIGALLATVNGVNDSSVYSNIEAKKALIGLIRDLRGLAFSFNTKTSFMLLFEWLYPSYTPILLRSMELWYADPEITTPLLKLYAELALNRSQRLQVDVSSPNGILLFREASKVVCTYGNNILNLDVQQDMMYKKKLKGISICFSMLKAALCGNYVNFGVFKLYGDDTLENALNIFVKLLLSIPLSDLMHYPKLSQTYYGLLECLAQDHMEFLSTLEPQVFLYILSSISEGLNALDMSICTGCCTTLDHIVTYVFKQLLLKGKKVRRRMQQVNEIFLRTLETHLGVFRQILQTVLNIIIFEECRNQWSMSRPLLGLILLNEEYFNQLRDIILQSQPIDKQPAMAQWFEMLMEGVERNLASRNRERFTQNLSSFKKELTEKGSTISMNSVNNEVMITT
ncbi:Armadillo-type fold,Armadillo-like helical,Importin-beta, N-terminal domain [Cinara cedri]|uniref:Armadillo-type fold,Armadillo-like helical,Importin-beta, N-terminal domain n=1 Tax=Cinara cedri TaxID=506608 RepID=A0A5E4NLE9_9HEMI|nr:Armadillo-type fold,Armadillo-like helical,Importin-beta, N-terminal domain [Cinara cedri]